eukprot:109371-Pleurochrysis_carterae.AAC.1
MRMNVPCATAVYNETDEALSVAQVSASIRAEFRRTRVAAIARAHVAKGADIRPWGVGRHAAASALAGGADVVLGDE